MAIPGWKILRRKIQWSRRCLLHGYSAATPELLRKLSAAGWKQTTDQSLFSLGKHVGSGDADLQATWPVNRRKCNLPSGRPEHTRFRQAARCADCACVFWRATLLETLIVKQCDLSTHERAISPAPRDGSASSPASGLSTDAADDVYAASVIRPLVAVIALAHFGRVRCLEF